MAKVGRPNAKIDKEQFEKLCSLQCTIEEIAGFFGCCDDTINNWCKKTYHTNFSVVFKDKSAPGKISLRRNQFRLSERSAAMAIFLGKQYLGQKDALDVSASEIGKVDDLLETLKGIADDYNG